MHRTPEEIKAFAKEMASLLMAQCATRGFDYEAVRLTLKLDWTIADLQATDEQVRVTNAGPLEILQRALACEKAGDQAGYASACLGWLSAKHDVRLGDTVKLVGGYPSKPRTVLLEGFSISLNEDDLLHSFAFFTGPCTSHKVRSSDPKSHSQYLDDSLLKITA